MRIRVDIGGLFLAWRFRGNESLGAWVEAMPWLDKPAVEIARVGDEATAEAVITAIEEECYLAGRHGGAPSTELLDGLVTAERGPAKAIAESLGLDSDKPLPEIGATVGNEAAVTPRVFIVPPLPTSRPQVRSELERFLDLVTKVEPLARCVAIILDTPGNALGGRCHDFIDGLVPSPTDLLSSTEPRAWMVYRHHRIAWETGGRITESRRLEAELTANDVRVGSEDVLESALDRVATVRFEKLSSEKREFAAAGVAACVERSDSITSLDPDLFWSPTETPGKLPRPWVARALLHADPGQSHASFLRNCLVCVPIGHALLAACSVFETQIRGRIRLPPIRPPFADRVDPWNGFQTPGSLSRALFPHSGPSVPTNPWEFASLGECLSHEVTKDRDGGWRHEIRILRNHLAHGHHVGWSAIQLMRRWAARVATG
jgi:hypothetical protein